MKKVSVEYEKYEDMLAKINAQESDRYTLCSAYCVVM